MSRVIQTLPLTPKAFAPFGEVLDFSGDPDMMINQGLCGRYHDKANLDFDDKGRAGVSLFLAKQRKLPYQLDMMERHPLGSQTFIPMTEHPFLVIVADDNNGVPNTPSAFLTDGAQAISFHRNAWHGVLTPLASPGRFAVIDRIGTGNNLQEHWFDEPWTILTS